MLVLAAALALSQQLIEPQVDAPALVLPCQAQQILENPALFGATPDNGNDHMGASLALGNWDGDAYLDLAVGGLLRIKEGVENGRTRVFVFRGLVGGTFDPVPAAVFRGESDRDQFGLSLAFLRDVNSDGRDELAVGAPNGHSVVVPGAGCGPAADRAGRVYLFLGGTTPAGLQGNAVDCAALIVHGQVAGGRLGNSVTAVDGFTGSANPDLFIGAPGSLDSSNGYRGVVYGLTGAQLAAFSLSDSCSTPPRIVADCQLALFQIGGAGRDRFGASLAPVADLTGDGLPELLVGATEFEPYELLGQDDASSNGPGYARIYSFQAPASLSLVLELEGDQYVQGSSAEPGEAFGFAVQAEADLDGDGVPEVVVGAPGYAADGKLLTGRVRVWSGAQLEADPSDPAAAHLFDLPGDNVEGLFGISLGSVADLFPTAGPGDGRDELLVGALNDSVCSTGKLPLDTQDPCSTLTCVDASYDLDGDLVTDPQAGYRCGSVTVVEYLPRGEGGGEGGSDPSKRLRVVGEGVQDHLGFAVASGRLGDDGPTDPPSLVCSGMAWSHPSVPSYAEPGRVYVFEGDAYPLDTRWRGEGHALETSGTVPPGNEGAPRLLGSGELVNGTRIQLALDRCLPVAGIPEPAIGSVIVVGFGVQPTPLPPGLAGIMVPLLNANSVLLWDFDQGVSLGMAGNYSYFLPVGPGASVPGTVLAFQAWVIEGADPLGNLILSASNGLSITAP